MGERVKQITGRVKGFFAGMSRRLRVLLIVIAALTVAAIIGLTAYRSSRPYTILFTELSTDDMSLVMTYLSENNITDFKVEDNNTILVRENQEARLKAAIYQQGFPTSGFGYGTYLENIGILSSQSDREALQLFELQDRLSATIRLMDGVREAQVNISTGSDTSYILSDNVVEATADVMVVMQTGRTLNDGQVTAIRNAVANATEGLDITNVTIHDQAGNNYSAGNGTTSISDSAQLKLALEAQVNETVRNDIMELLLRMYGKENLEVRVNSTVDVSHTYVDDYLYYLPEYAQNGETDGRGIIGSRVWGNYLIREGNENVGGVAGTSSNADLNEYVVREGDLTGNETEINTSGETNYDTSHTQTQSETLGGTVTDLMVSVVINSRYFEDRGLARPSMDDLVPAVARAAGINSEYQFDKISILIQPFYTELPVETEPPEPAEELGFLDRLPPWALYALIGGSALFVILLVLIIILLSRRRRKKKKGAQLLERQQALEQFTPNMVAVGAGEIADTGADIMNLNTERSMELRKDVRQFAEENPAIAAQMVKNWLRGSEEH